MRTRRPPAVLELLVLVALVLLRPSPAPAADAGRSWDFGAGAGPEWSSRPTLAIGGVAALGPFNRRNAQTPDGTTLSLTDIAPGNYTLSFDLYLIGSWDSAGSDKADVFEVGDGTGRVLLRMTEFPCRIEGADEGRPVGHAGLVRTPLSERELGYWIVPVRIALGPESFAGGRLSLTFRGAPTARRVESWAIAAVGLRPR